MKLNHCDNQQTSQSILFNLKCHNAAKVLVILPCFVIKLRLILNSRFSCLGLTSDEITGIHNCTQLKLATLTRNKYVSALLKPWVGFSDSCPALILGFREFQLGSQLMKCT